MPTPFTVYYAGTQAEVAHHAAPLSQHCNLRIAEPDEVLELAAAGDVVVFYSEHFDRFREACSQLKRRGVGTLYAIDGILEWRNAWENQPTEVACPWAMRPVLADKVACISRHQARVLAEWGNADKVEVVGLPRLDDWVAEQQQKATPPADDTAPFRLLIATAKVPGFTPEQYAVTLCSLQELKAWLDANPSIGKRKIEVTWRLTADLAEQLGVSNSLLSTAGADFHSQLRRSDAVITTHSTAMIEAMVGGLPTVLLDYHCCPNYVPAAWTIRHAGDIEPIVTELTKPPTHKIQYQQSVLRDELETQGPATRRMLQLVTAIHEFSARRAAAGEKLPARIVPLAAVTGDAPELAELFPTYAGFQLDNVTELQAQLCHARREIDHLHERLEQLRKELGQAHEIFAQIHRHPIAGPIVRMRQRLIEKMRSWNSRSRSTPAAATDASATKH